LRTPFKVSEKRILGGKVPLCTRATAARSAEVKESFEDSRRISLRRESAFIHRALKVIAEAKIDPLESLSLRKLRRKRIFKERGLNPNSQDL
jgi:hypothetical protein